MTLFYHYRLSVSILIPDMMRANVMIWDFTLDNEEKNYYNIIIL